MGGLSSVRRQWLAADVGSTAKPVGAGLPAMQTTRFNSYTALIPSRASPLPQGIRSASGLEGATEPVGGLPAMQTTRFNSCTALIPSRASPLPLGIRSASGLEGANEPVGAGLPAMQTTRFNSYTALIPSRASPHWESGQHQTSRAPMNLWEACLRCRRRGLTAAPH